MALVTKNPLPKQEMKETWVQFVGQEDSSILARKIPGTEEPGGLGSQKAGHN